MAYFDGPPGGGWGGGPGNFVGPRGGPSVRPGNRGAQASNSGAQTTGGSGMESRTMGSSTMGSRTMGGWNDRGGMAGPGFDPFIDPESLRDSRAWGPGGPRGPPYGPRGPARMSLKDRAAGTGQSFDAEVIRSMNNRGRAGAAGGAAADRSPPLDVGPPPPADRSPPLNG